MSTEEVKEGLVVQSEQEAQLGKEISSIEKTAEALVIRTEEDYAYAGSILRDQKSLQKKIEDFMEPMRKASYDAYKAVMDRKNAMLEPLKKVERILKPKMAKYSMEQERLRKEAEEKMRKLAQAEIDRKLEEAAKAESNGDHAAAEYAMAEAEVLDSVSSIPVQSKPTMKLTGISQMKTWEIKKIDLSKLPCEFAGALIRPADEKAIMALIKATKGNIVIPGVEYEETVSLSVRAS